MRHTVKCLSFLCVVFPSALGIMPLLPYSLTPLLPRSTKYQ